MEFNIKLNLNELNYVIATLGKKPFEEVSELIQSIRKQAIEQVNNQQEDAAE
jgi:soluble P-type ATPase